MGGRFPGVPHSCPCVPERTNRNQLSKCNFTHPNPAIIPAATLSRKQVAVYAVACSRAETWIARRGESYDELANLRLEGVRCVGRGVSISRLNFSFLSDPIEEQLPLFHAKPKPETKPSQMSLERRSLCCSFRDLLPKESMGSPTRDAMGVHRLCTALCRTLLSAPRIETEHHASTNFDSSSLRVYFKALLFSLLTLRSSGMEALLSLVRGLVTEAQHDVQGRMLAVVRPSEPDSSLAGF